MSSRRDLRARGIVYALIAAVCFGGSTPFVRPALARTDPAAAAGYLYLGQALVLTLWWLASRARSRQSETDLDRGDLLPLLAGIVAGGLVAPGAFMAGLALVSAHRASLLLSLEIAFTLLIAIIFRGERLSASGWVGIVLLFAAAVWIAAQASPDTPAAAAVPLAGSLLVVLACLGWAVDSNVTAGIAGKDPAAISLLKGWAAAAAYLGACVVLGRPVGAAPGDLALLLTAGAIGYGVALTAFIVAMRHLGAALTTGLFSIAPISGFLISVGVFGERPGAAGWVGLALAGAGVAVIAWGINRSSAASSRGPGRGLVSREGR